MTPVSMFEWLNAGSRSCNFLDLSPCLNLIQTVFVFKDIQDVIICISIVHVYITIFTKSSFFVDVNVKDFAAVASWCKENLISLVVVGPEDPLSQGISDVLTKEGQSRAHRFWRASIHQSLFCWIYFWKHKYVAADYIDGLVQDCSISIANALAILQSCTKPSI